MLLLLVTLVPIYSGEKTHPDNFIFKNKLKVRKLYLEKKTDLLDSMLRNKIKFKR